MDEPGLMSTVEVTKADVKNPWFQSATVIHGPLDRDGHFRESGIEQFQVNSSSSHHRHLMFER